MKPKSKTTVPISVRIPLDQFNEIEKRDINIADFLREQIEAELFSNEKILEEIKNHEEKIVSLKSLLIRPSKLKEKGSEKEKFFRVAREKIKENPNFLLGQWEKYKNLFEKISLEKFQEMVHEV